QWSVEADGWDSRKLPWSRIRIMRSDNEGGLWVSLREEGLAHVRSDGSIHRITSAEGLPSQVVQAFFPDNEGNLWTGYHRGGLVRVRRSLFRTIARPEGLADTVVTSVAEDTGGAIWIGSSGGSVARWQEGHLTNFTLPLRGAFCQDSVVCAGADGRVWVGTGGNGLLVFEDGKFRHVLLPGQLPQGVRSLLARRDGSVCYANFGGLFAVKDGKAVRMLEAKRTDDVPGALAEGPNGELWMGTLGGALMRMNDGKWEKFQPQDGRPASRFWSLWPEADGSIWIGTLDQGLLYFKDGKFTRFTRAEGLLDEGISQILSDGNDLWLGSRIGVLRVSRASLLRRVNHQVDTIGCRVFGRGNGLLTTAMALEFGPNCLRSRDGRLWFSSANGLAWTLPSDVGHRQIAPPVVIEKILADGKGIETSGVGGDLVPQAKGPLRLGPGVRNLEIHFTAPNLTAPELIEFRYRLQEVDGDWLDAGKHRSVVFTRLAPGAYTFDVSARNSDGIWSSAGATLHFVIVPHYWERRMFQAGVVILVVGLALLAIRVWTKRRMQHKLDRLERQRELERERTRIAQDLHDDLGAGLTEISLTSDLATNPELDASASAHYVTEIGSKARELVTTMDEIVWAVNPRNDSVASLAAYFCQFAQHLLKSSGIRCRLDVNESLPASPLRSEQRHQLFLAFKESLNNVVRHSGASEARLAIHVENGQLCLTLEDDGRGFGDGAGGVGSDGLRNMQDRLRRISGVCEVSSQPERGTKVVFRAPLPEAEQ
ncbi:MAG: sensor histidine kinase, partial [Verrucomicrobiota bacterium]